MPKSPKKQKKKKPASEVAPQGKQSLQSKGLWKDNPQGTK